MKNRKLEKVEKLRGVILGLEMSLKLLDDDLEEVNKNLTYLNKFKKDLIYNINLHRSGKVVTIVTAYRKSIEELEICNNEILKYINYKTKIQRDIDKKSKLHECYLLDFDVAFDALKNEAVILLFKKGTNE